MKIVVLERDAYGDGSHRFYLGLLQMAGDLGYRIRLCRPLRNGASFDHQIANLMNTQLHIP